MALGSTQEERDSEVADRISQLLERDLDELSRRNRSELERQYLKFREAY